ncbi:UNVERIFIED_CONTAM: hypothetical protein Sangu_1995000 [Sesamum angustifolium]|uniref:Uncharacterized protein n=1 Tax=Sesamum angustifolium TaxID=2727405 RepID=A0AAW2LI17_9LAMI
MVPPGRFDLRAPAQPHYGIGTAVLKLLETTSTTAFSSDARTGRGPIEHFRRVSSRIAIIRCWIRTYDGSGNVVRGPEGRGCDRKRSS